MVERKEGGPAFAHGDPANGGDSGMSLRDYFAAQALPAVIAAYATANDQDTGKPLIGTDHLPRNVAGHAYAIADAMLAERAK